MIEMLDQSRENVLGFRIGGTITAEEEEKWIEMFDAPLSKYDKLNILIELDKHTGWTLKAAFEDYRWVSKHAKNIDKLAVVCESKVWEWLITMDSKLLRIDEKHFSDIDEAWDYVLA